MSWEENTMVARILLVVLVVLVLLVSSVGLASEQQCLKDKLEEMLILESDTKAMNNGFEGCTESFLGLMLLKDIQVFSTKMAGISDQIYLVGQISEQPLRTIALGFLQMKLGEYVESMERNIQGVGEKMALFQDQYLLLMHDKYRTLLREIVVCEKELIEKLGDNDAQYEW